MQNILATRLQELKKNQTDLSKLLGIPPSAANKIVRGTRPLHGNEIYKVAKFLNYNVEDFARYMSGDIDIDVRDAEDVKQGHIRIPYYNAVASAGVGLYTGTEYTQSYIDVSVGKFADKLQSISRCSAISVQGDSMEPSLHDGDIVVVDTADHARQIIDGRIYVININDKLYIKRLFFNPVTQMLMLRSDNNLYPQMDISPDDARICGRLIMRVFDKL